MSIENKFKEREKLQDKLFELEKEIKKDLYQLERDAFSGLTYREYIDTLQKEINVNENISIRIDRWNIYGFYKLDAITQIVVTGTIYGDDHIFQSEIAYRCKTTQVPKKHQEKLQELLDECRKLKVVNPSKKYQEKYKISIF